VPSPENGFSNLLRKFLGWQSSGGIDLDHATFKARWSDFRGRKQLPGVWRDLS
jgi:hypothetical protein